MNRHVNSLPLILAFVVTLSGAALAQTTASRSEIKARMKARYPELVKLKEKGNIGETHLGFVAAVTAKDSANKVIAKIVKDENADRQQLYQLIAKGAKSTVEEVGKTNAARIFDKAGNEEFFKGKDGKWRKKKGLRKK